MCALPHVYKIIIYLHIAAKIIQTKIHNGKNYGQEKTISIVIWLKKTIIANRSPRYNALKFYNNIGKIN